MIIPSPFGSWHQVGYMSRAYSSGRAVWGGATLIEDSSVFVTFGISHCRVLVVAAPTVILVLDSGRRGCRPVDCAIKKGALRSGHGGRRDNGNGRCRSPETFRDEPGRAPSPGGLQLTFTGNHPANARDPARREPAAHASERAGSATIWNLPVRCANMEGAIDRMA